MRQDAEAVAMFETERKRLREDVMRPARILRATVKDRECFHKVCGTHRESQVFILNMSSLMPLPFFHHRLLVCLPRTSCQDEEEKKPDLISIMRPLVAENPPVDAQDIEHKNHEPW